MPALAQNRDAILKEWLARTLETYPFLNSEEQDRFRNPVRYVLREGLPVLLDEVLGEMDGERLRAALEQIVKMRAVQDFSPGAALSFLFTLRRIVTQIEPAADLSSLHERIDQVALLAFELYLQCRERVYRIQANEARRSVFLLEKLAAQPSGDQA